MLLPVGGGLEGGEGGGETGGDPTIVSAMRTLSLHFCVWNGESGEEYGSDTGNPDFTYNPGTILFNSPISSSPVIYGDNVLFADESGYLYSFNIEKNEAPTPIFFYYSLAVLIIVLAICVVAIKKYRRK